MQQSSPTACDLKFSTQYVNLQTPDNTPDKLSSMLRTPNYYHHRLITIDWMCINEMGRQRQEHETGQWGLPHPAAARVKQHVV
eukprot:scaffold435541_cov18-Prasinocladus_malaysianus.AAC.1